MPARLIIWSFFALLLCTPTAAAQTRTVVMVYDDSGSMGDPGEEKAPWRDANYALQILVGLLAQRDALHVVRMSAPSIPEKVELGDQRSQISTLRTTPHPGGGTPYEAVQTAMRVLDQAADQEARTGAEPTEKWLIVITDGQFFNGGVDASARQRLGQEVRTFVDRTGARTALLLIGEIESEIADIWQREVQALRYEAPDRSQIAEQMRRIASDITSRSDQPLAVQVQGNTATFTSEFPLRRITVLQQQGQPTLLAGIRSARVTTGALDIPAALGPAMPDGSANPVYGRIHHLQGATPDAVIAGGTVTLEFDQAVDPRRLQVFPEVAARLEVWLTDARDGPLPEPLCVGEEFRIRATLLSPAGDTLIGQVHNRAQFRLESEYGPRRLRLAPARAGSYYETAIAAAEGDLAVSVSAAYPGYFNYRSRVFTVRASADSGRCRQRALDFLPVQPWSARVTDLDGAPWMELVPTADGVPIPPTEMEQWLIRRVDDGKLRVDVERSPQGWRLRPRLTRGLACCTPTGRIPVEYEVRSPNPREAPLVKTVEFHVQDVGFWKKCGWLILALLLAIAIAVYVILILRKRRFCRGSEIVYQRIRPLTTQRPQTEGLPGKSWFVRWLVPTRAERTVGLGVTFEAGTRCGSIILPPGAQTENMYVQGEKIEDPGRRALRIANGEALEVRHDSGTREVYTYHLR